MSKGIEQDVAFIEALARLLTDSDLTEIEVEREYGEDDELKVRLSRMAPAAPAAAPPHHVMVPQAPQPQPQLVTPAASTPIETQPDGPDLSNAVTSPMVGTAYLAPEPDADHFVSIGDEVAEGQTLLIIEAMKTMNPIPAPRAGKVRAILIGNAEPVEFGEPLVILE